MHISDKVERINRIRRRRSRKSCSSALSPVTRGARGIPVYSEQKYSGVAKKNSRTRDGPTIPGAPCGGVSYLSTRSTLSWRPDLRVAHSGGTNLFVPLSRVICLGRPDTDAVQHSNVPRPRVTSEHNGNKSAWRSREGSTFVSFRATGHAICHAF